jgi:hypothetical protein
MKKIAIGVLTAATLLTAVPAMAQVGIYAGPGGVGVDVGAPAPYRCGYGYPCNRGYYDSYGGPGVVVNPGWHRGWRHDNWHRY